MRISFTKGFEQICVCKKGLYETDIRTQGLKNDDDQGDKDLWMLMNTSISLGGEAMGHLTDKKMTTNMMIRIQDHEIMSNKCN